MVSQSIIEQQCFRLTAAEGYHDHNVVIVDPGRAALVCPDRISRCRTRTGVSRRAM
jgi:hypothetical protein